MAYVCFRSITGLWLAVIFGSIIAPTIAHAADETVQLTLTYTQRNGLSGPSGLGDFAVGSMQAGLAAAGAMKSLNSLGKIFEALSSGQQITTPKTTGETNREMVDQALALKAASLPRKSGYRATLDATLVWHEAEGVYRIKHGTLQWRAFNNSVFQGQGHDLFTNLSASGTHKLKPDEITITYTGEKLSQALAGKAEATGTYTLAVQIQPKPAPATGHSGWIVGQGHVYESKERYTAGGVEILTTDEYQPTADGNDMAATKHRAVDKRPPAMFDPKFQYKAEARPLVQGKGQFSEAWLDMTGTWHSISWTVYLPGTLVAVPGGPYGVERGGEVELDGTQSKGEIEQYEWTFTPVEPAASGAGESAPYASMIYMAAAPGGGAGAGGASDAGRAGKSGSKVQITNIAPVMAELTVKGKKGTDTARTFVEAFPRDFKIRYDGKDDERILPLAGAGERVQGLTIMPLADDSVAAGINFCACQNLAALSDYEKVYHYLHTEEPHPPMDWEDKGYTLDQVNDPKGPWDKFWYVSELKVSILRRAYISPYFLPDAKARGAVPPGADKDWYRENQDHRAILEKDEFKKANLSEDDFNPEAYLQAVKKHEHSHSRLIKKHIDAQGQKIGQEFEAIHSKNRKEVKDRADLLCSAVNDDLHNLGRTIDDPAIAIRSAVMIWSGQIRLWNGTGWVDRPDQIFAAP